MNPNRLGSVYFLLIILVLTAGVPLAASRGRQFIDEHPFRQIMDRSSVAEDARRSLLIYAKLDELRVNSGASRAYIYLFHDGPWLSTGKPMTMMSRAYESVAGGLDTVSSMALIVSRYPAVLELLTGGEQPLIFEIVQAEAGGADLLAATPGTRFVAMHLIACDGQIIGWLGMDFEDAPGPDVAGQCAKAASAVSRLLEKSF